MASNRAHLGDFPRDSREGLSTKIGETGIKPSGGPRHGFAKFLYIRPKLLFLDAATKALGTETEQAIAQTLRELKGRVTIVHRLATIRRCDFVVCLGSE